jgi:hypothetical protein
LHSLVNKLTAGAVHGQHVEVDATNLGIEVGAYRTACRHISLHDIADNLDHLCILKADRVLVRLSDDVIPLD